MASLPSVLAFIGMGLMCGGAGAASAIGLGISGQSVIGMMKKKPDLFGTGLVLSALPASQGLYGFVAFIMYNGAITTIGAEGLSVFHGSVALASGIMVAASCLASAILQGKICATGMAAMADGHNVFGQAMILTVSSELYAILSLVASIIMLSFMK